MINNNQKTLRKVAEEQELNTGKTIYLDIFSWKKQGYGCSNNWILFQDSDTNQKWYCFTEKRVIDLKSHHFPKETEYYKE